MSPSCGSYPPPVCSAYCNVTQMCIGSHISLGVPPINTIMRIAKPEFEQSFLART